jgi:hypothetical protein
MPGVVIGGERPAEDALVVLRPLDVLEAPGRPEALLGHA